MSAKQAGPGPEAARPGDEQTPSSSGVVAREGLGVARLESDRPSFRALTPYQARLDVEMDDTAVSKVRDPSVSISLGVGQAVGRRRLRFSRPDPLTSVALGALLGVVLVLVVAVIVRLAAR